MLTITVLQFILLLFVAFCIGAFCMWQFVTLVLRTDDGKLYLMRFLHKKWPNSFHEACECGNPLTTWTAEDVWLDDEVDEAGDWNVWLGSDTVVAWSLSPVAAERMATNLKLAFTTGKKSSKATEDDFDKERTRP